MSILLSNDDGIHAPGIRVLYEALKGVDELRIAAPDAERSAVGHAITLSDPIKTRRIEGENGFSGYAVGGTPADCVKLAVCALLESPPALVVSGINLGPNAGISVIYSGTVSAATEGTILGIPSVALSLDTFKDPIWPTARRVARQVVEQTLAHGLPADTLLNVNIPNRPFEELKGYRVTRMGRSRFVEFFDRRTDPRGNVYYWMDGNLERLGETENTDLEALEEGYVSLTPIGFDLTHENGLEPLRSWGLALA